MSRNEYYTQKNFRERNFTKFELFIFHERGVFGIDDIYESKINRMYKKIKRKD